MNPPLHSNDDEATIGQSITLDEAKAWTATYQHDNPDKLRSVYFSNSVFTELMAQPNTKGIRIYLANNGSTDTMVLVSANSTTDLVEDGYKVFNGGLLTPPNHVDSPLQH
ncbi:hypothetical protein [Hymenobacter sp. APR13]|uniref:hypothetical protein n=1 Tax=Hymenobacter sp. APR13 TaxID=1356852 RepID=UPI0004E03B88|nr:hypothetical protein [Hymenobacter sp. APR13]AII51020.1 hypothetical protein N008_03355 [Hymenobacter sp. APR13]